jgi:hypothetical protein
MTDPDETYLGDGLYASFDGFSFILRASGEYGDYCVGLEPDVFNALVRYREAVYAKHGVKVPG